MKINNLFILLALLFVFQSCETRSERTTEIKDNWDFSQKEFKDNNVRFLSMYDVFDFHKQSDSTIILEGAIFKGW